MSVDLLYCLFKRKYCYGLTLKNSSNALFPIIPCKQAIQDSKTWLVRRWHRLERSALAHQRLPNVKTTLEKNEISVGVRMLIQRWADQLQWSNYDGHYAKQANNKCADSSLPVQNLISVTAPEVRVLHLVSFHRVFSFFFFCFCFVFVCFVLFCFCLLTSQCPTNYNVSSAALSNVSEIYII